MASKTHFPDINLYKVEKGDLKQAEEMLADAFSDDPGVTYIMNNRVGDINLAKSLHRFNLKYGMRYGAVYATSAKLEGIVIFIPPQETKMSPWKAIRSGGLFLCTKSNRGTLKAIRAFEETSIKLHVQYASFPHWYLMAIAVNKKYQGKHMASLLLNPFINYFDSHGYPCYLETHKKNNAEIYEHYGFRIKEVCNLPDSSTQHWAMLRLPKREVQYE